MAERQPSPTGDDLPVVDPDAVRREYRRAKARRRKRIEHQRRTRRAGARFWIVLLLLVVCAVLIALSTWRLIGQLFGL